ncbi:MAG: hypothetical protein L6R36_004883 [Xanthoria steineri]|nr:MAG: hypothetical protein L6R36_004883 [Xanthoria steineri]
MLLPNRYSNDECTFILSIKTPGITTLADNWEIWGAAAAVTEMCIKYGKNGQAGMLGDDNIMALTSGPSLTKQPPSILMMNTTLPDSNPVKLFTEE